MKYVCTSGGNYQLLNDEPIFIKSHIDGERCYNLKEIYLEKNKLYDVICINEFFYNDKTYKYKLMVKEKNNNTNCFYLTQNDLNKYFKELKQSHYAVKTFLTVDDLNKFLESLSLDDFKDVKFNNSNFMLIYKIKGDN